MRRSAPQRIGIGLAALGIAAWSFFPIYWMVVSSLRTRRSVRAADLPAEDRVPGKLPKPVGRDRLSAAVPQLGSWSPHRRRDHARLPQS
jgi:ABC-type glycerol-3-phosphate transport system permease component